MPKRTLLFLKVIRDEQAPDRILRGESYREDILRALDPTTWIERYGRIWRISAPEIIGGRWLWGKLGFLTIDDTVEYDEQNHDFVILGDTRQRASFSHFVLDLDSQFLVFEIRPPDIRLGSFRGALNGLLKRADLAYPLTAEIVVDERTLENWLNTVDLVSNFKVSVRRPNPVWDSRFKSLQDFLDNANAAKATVEVTAREDESLNVAGSQLQSYADYIAAGYGRIRVTGSKDGRTLIFDSDNNPRRVSIESLKDEGSESIVSKLIERIKDMLP